MNTGKGTKKDKVKKHLERYKYINRSTAFSNMQVQNLPDVIQKLRGEGLQIETQNHNGLTRYHLID